MTGVGAEVANAEVQRESERRRRVEGGRGSESMREEVATAAIHGRFTQQMRGDRISHRESGPKGSWKHRDRGGGGTRRADGP